MPVAPREITTNINQVADKVVVMHSPYLFSAVVKFYRDFSQASDSEVKEIISKHGHINILVNNKINRLCYDITSLYHV